MYTKIINGMLLFTLLLLNSGCSNKELDITSEKDEVKQLENVLEENIKKEEIQLKVNSADSELHSPASTELKSIEISEDNGRFYLNGITLGDTRDQVIELLGTDYIETSISREVINKTITMLHDSSLDYGHLIVNIQNDAVNQITVPNMNEKYYEDMFNLYIEDGIVYTNGEDFYTHSGARIFYSEGHPQTLLAKYIGEDMRLILYLNYRDENFFESLDSGYIKKISINE